MSEDIIEIIKESEEETEIYLDWFYHESYYNYDNYKNILTEGIKCNYLLNKSSVGRYNGPYYISLAKITIPDNVCFKYYIYDRNPSFVIDGINPIECLKDPEYEKYIETKDPRRMGNLIGEYQQYYQISNENIKGILYNLYYCIFTIKDSDSQKFYLNKVCEIIQLLKELKIDIPIYDFSRRNLTNAHLINKEKLLYLSRNVIN